MPSLPQHVPSPRELDDLELMLVGALTPGFNRAGSSITLDLAAAEAEVAASAGGVELVDPEGLPLAQVSWPDGDVTPLARPEYGPFRRLYLTPEECRTRYAGRRVVACRAPLSSSQVAGLDGLDDVVLLVLVGAGAGELSPVALLRAALAVPPDVVAVPLADHPEVEAEVLAAYAGDAAPLVLEAAALDSEHPSAVEEVVRGARPDADERGLVLFFTGLSGSGKSTVARAVMDAILERGHRTLTSLDGDVVRTHLSKGLTFSKEDRETNIRRIGWVAAQIAHHGGLAVCSPIAPFDGTRQQVRRMVRDAGGAFFLVHVATPLEECERRDRKGLYAKARAGEIPEFTGISSPYEEPADADLRVDTTGRSVEAVRDEVLSSLSRAGLLR